MKKSAILFFDDGGTNKALTHSLVISVCMYFRLPIMASLSPNVSFNSESIFSMPQFSSTCLLTNSSKALLNFIGGIENDGESCCFSCCCLGFFNSIPNL